jgi:hypothetical protein
MSTWIFQDEAVAKKLDQLEMEWDRINLSQMDAVSFDDATRDTEQQIEVNIE